MLTAFRVVIPFVEFRNEHIEQGQIILTTSALADGRLPGLLNVALIDQRLILPRQVLSACESMKASDNIREQMRGTRALNLLDQLRHSPINNRIEIIHTDIPQANNINDTLLVLPASKAPASLPLMLNLPLVRAPKDSS